MKIRLVSNKSDKGSIFRMQKNKLFNFRLLFLISLVFITIQTNASLKVGAECTEDYIHLLKNKRVAIIANQTSFISNTHLVDSLLSMRINIVKIFAPEHGFRGNADAGEKVGDSTDSKTGIPLISLYGKHYKPTATDLKGVDILLFDIQDVGVRFYTYISTMHYAMEACAENNVEFMVLDRPNPNGYYVDGPVLEAKYKSFVGMHPVPLIHGMTVAEYARMINGEHWLKNGIQCKLTTILCDGYDHQTRYELPRKPSPNLPNARAIALYPVLGLLEGTVMSCGRGTDFPFQVVGHPEFTDTSFSFTPRSIPGASKFPPFEGVTCYGIDLRTDASRFYKDGVFNIPLLKYIYDKSSKKDEFFNSFFLNLSGTEKLKQLLQKIAITETDYFWKEDVKKFMEVRGKYLLYKN